MKHLDKIAFAGLFAAMADPVLAGVRQVPAPIAGVGIAAVALIGFGYRALKSRIGR